MNISSNIMYMLNSMKYIELEQFKIKNNLFDAFFITASRRPLQSKLLLIIILSNLG
jgi:hypothetical protein